MGAHITLTDDNNDQWETPVEPGKVIAVEDYFIPCVCGRIVLLGVAGNDAEGCHTCKKEDKIMNDVMNTDPKAIYDWLHSWEWDYEHPGYWVREKPYGRIMVGEYVGFYIGDPGQDGNEAFKTIDYDKYEEAVDGLRRSNLIDDDDERHIRLAMRYEQLTRQAEEDKPHWEWEGGSLMYPDGIIIYNRLDKNLDRSIRIHKCILIGDVEREMDDSEHEYLRDLADKITLWLNNNIA